ncbi:MAG TPA: response regulator transcription factor, partial [Chitinophagaceae bacterium]|nr:response regulator transcription factor [Chitinophagaceae bacterium]
TDTLVKIATGEKWDIVISDLAMPGGGGLEGLRRIREKVRDLPVLMISYHPAEYFAERAIKAGASGFINKTTAYAELVKAVKQVLSGKKYISKSILEKTDGALNKHSEGMSHELLSKREFAIFKLLATGKSNKEIAAALSINASTVSTYRQRLLAKMKMDNIAHIIQYAMDYKLI